MEHTALHEVAKTATWRAVDEELSQLPEKYRGPLMLCYLEGKSRVQAAVELGLSDAVVKGRLQRGRHELRLRLVRRGVWLTVASGSLAISTGATGTPWIASVDSGVPEELIGAMAEGATQFASSGSVGGAVTTQALQLAEGELMILSATSIVKSAAAAAIAVAIVGISYALFSNTVVAENVERSALALRRTAERGVKPAEDVRSAFVAGGNLVAFQAGSSNVPRDEVQKIGPFDYTTMTGFIANASLPAEQPTAYWKLVSEVDIQSIEDADRPIEMIALTDSVVGDGVVYVASRSAPGKVYALNADDGSQVWQYDHSAAGISEAPSIDENHVYFGSDTGVTALRRDTGDVVWNTVVEHGVGEAPPIPVGDRVYVSGYDGVAYALNQADGSVVWRRNSAHDAPHDPPDFPGERARFQEIAARPRGAACDGELFIQSVFDQSRVIALDCETGELRWSFQANGWIGPAPTIVGDRVYIGSQDKHLYCLDRETGAVVWKFLAPTWIASRVAVHNGIVFLPIHGARLFQLDAESGELLREFVPEDEADRAGLVYSFPIIADGTAYFASGEGHLYAIGIETNALKWKLRPSEESQLYTNPTTDGRMVFVTCRQNADKGGECALIAIGPTP